MTAVFRGHHSCTHNCIHGSSLSSPSSASFFQYIPSLHMYKPSQPCLQKAPSWSPPIKIFTSSVLTDFYQCYRPQTIHYSMSHYHLVNFSFTPTAVLSQIYLTMPQLLLGDDTHSKHCNCLQVGLEILTLQPQNINIVSVWLFLGFLCGGVQPD